MRMIVCCIAAWCAVAGPAAALPASSAAHNVPIHLDVRSHGARGDGRHLNTESIQSAIDAAASAGGGTVHIPAGVYLTGSLALRSHVTLDLHAGATLLASTDIRHHRSRRGLIHAEGVEHVAVRGRGLIDGQGGNAGPTSRPADSEKDTLTAARARGKVLHFARCRNVRVEGITLRNSPNWMQHYFDCDNVVIDGVTVQNHCNHYNDGIDIDNCRDVRISNCRISSGDDAIVLKSRSERFCENVTITNCIVSSHSNGFKLGTESHGGFRNVTISNSVVTPVDPAEPQRNGAQTGLAGLAVETVDGGLLERVAISNITIHGTVAPIFVRLGNRGRKLREDMETPPVGTLRHVSITNIVATGASSVGCAIAGLPGHRIEDLVLSDISITFGATGEFINYAKVPPGGTIADVQREIPERADAYPECIMFGKLPAYGFYVRHADGVALRNVRLRWTDRDQRPALFCEDVRDLQIEGLSARSAADAAPVVFLRDVERALIRGCMAAPETRTFLRVEGHSKSVSLIGNHLAQAGRISERGDAAPAEALFEDANDAPRGRAP